MCRTPSSWLSQRSYFTPPPPVHLYRSIHTKQPPVDVDAYARCLVGTNPTKSLLLPGLHNKDGVGEAAAEEQPPSPGSGGPAAAGGTSPMLVGSGDQAPRPSRLVGLPIKWRPLFPTTAYTYTITNPDVLTAVAKSSRVRIIFRARDISIEGVCAVVCPVGWVLCGRDAAVRCLHRVVLVSLLLL